MPAADVSRDAQGFLTPAAAAAWKDSFQPLAQAVSSSVVIKPSTEALRYGRIGLVGQFLRATGLGPYIVETAPGSCVYLPAYDEVGKKTRKPEPEYLAWYLMTMAHGGRARAADGTVQLVGARARRARAASIYRVRACAHVSDGCCPTARAVARTAPKNGSAEHRSRPGVATMIHGKKPGEVLKAGTYGIGCYKERPYRHKTITAHADALRWFYQLFPDTRGHGDGQNPAYAKVVKDTLYFIGLVTGRARLTLPDAMEPWMVQRIVSCLRADDVRDCAKAAMISHGMTLGERPESWWIRNHADMVLSGTGLELFRAYHKTDKEQARARQGVLCGSRRGTGRGACVRARLRERLPFALRAVALTPRRARMCVLRFALPRVQGGSKKGIPHVTGCVNQGKDTCTMATFDVNGVAFFDGDNFCPACITGHYRELLKSKFNLTDEDIAGMPVFAEYCRVADVPSGGTLVKIASGSVVDATKLRPDVKVVTIEEERAKLMYRGEWLGVQDDSDESVNALVLAAAGGDVSHFLAPPPRNAVAEAADAAEEEAAAEEEEAAAAQAEAEPDEEGEEEPYGDGRATAGENAGAVGGAGAASRRRRVAGVYFEFPNGMAVHAWPLVRVRGRGRRCACAHALCACRNLMSAHCAARRAERGVPHAHKVGLHQRNPYGGRARAPQQHGCAYAAAAVADELFATELPRWFRVQRAPPRLAGHGHHGDW
jgi:hypothetical protein